MRLRLGATETPDRARSGAGYYRRGRHHSALRTRVRRYVAPWNDHFVPNDQPVEADFVEHGRARTRHADSTSSTCRIGPDALTCRYLDCLHSAFWRDGGRSGTPTAVWRSAARGATTRAGTGC